MALIDAVFADRPGMTPQDVERQRRLAQKLLEESSGTEPLQHPLQAVAKMLTAGVGAYRDSKARKGEQAGLDYRRQEWGRALAGGAAATPAAGAVPSPLPATATGAQIEATDPTPGTGNDYFSAIRAAESGGNDQARNPTSSATGRYQFIDSTWNGLMQKYPELGLTADGRMDPQQQEKAIRAFTRDNATALASAGIDATPGNLYAAHFLGAGGARNVLSGDDASPVSAYVSPDVISANPFLRNMTVGDFRNWSSRKGGGGAGPVDLGGTQTASLDPASGMPPPPAAIEAQAPTPYRDPMVVQAPQATALASPEMQASTAPNRQPMAPQLPPPINVSTPAVPPQNAQLAQVLTGGQVPQPTPGISPQVIQRLLGNPWTADIGEKMAESYVNSQMQQQQAAREAAMRQAERQAQWAREDSRHAIEDSRADRSYGLDREKFEADQRNATMTGDIREYEFAKGQGYQGSFADYQRDMKRAGAQNINMGTIPPGYQLVTDPVTNAQRMEPIPGSPASNANDKSAESRETATSVITTAAQRAREAMAGATFPTDGTVGSFLSKMPGTAAAEVRRQVAVLKSNATIENLNAMRRESPTGGALGSVTQEENAMLAAKAGALDPDSPNFPRDLDDYERSLLRTIHGKEAGDAIYAQTRAVAPQADTEGGVPDGVDPSIWEAMTPEERALWQN